MSNVKEIKTTKPSESIAVGLREVAKQIEDGATATRAIIILVHSDRDGDDHEMAFFGAAASTAEIVGILEIAKIDAVTS